MSISSRAESFLVETAGRRPEPAAVIVRGLRHAYGAAEVLHGIELRVERGEIFALLGPNGAGKTTTLEILEGFRARSGGEVEVLGADPGRAGRSWRARIGVMLQESRPEPELTVRECLSLYAGYHAHPRPVEDTLRQVGLADLAPRRCGALSGGEQRRLDLALALIGDPELLFLDEPTTGLDPAARRASWTLVDGLRRLGTTIVLTTHYMEEAERLADRIAVIARGRIVATGTPQSLRAGSSADTEISFTVPPGVRASDLPGDLAVGTVDVEGRVRLQRREPVPALLSLTSWAAARGHDLRDLQVRRPTLEDVYLELTAESDD
jgi:ABC-2 type transport system ATP-binding protein